MFTIIIIHKLFIPCTFKNILSLYIQNTFKFVIRRNMIVKWAYFYNFIMIPHHHPPFFFYKN